MIVSFIKFSLQFFFTSAKLIRYLGILGHMFSRWFKKKEERVKVKEDSLEQWFGKQEQEFFKDMFDLIRAKREGLKESITGIETALKALEAAQLKNKKIPERAYHAMQGNRNFYVSRMRQFIQGLDFPKGPQELMNYCDGFAERTTSLGKSTMKSYYVLQEFFANESSKVAQGLKQLESSVKGIGDSIRSSKFPKMMMLRAKIKEYQQQKDRYASLKGMQEKAEAELKGLRKEMETDEKDRHEIATSKAMEECALLEQNVKSMAGRVKDMELELQSKFSPLEAAMKKYERMTLKDSLIRRYLESPVMALLSDSDFFIAPELEKMGQAIGQGKLELKDKKKEKSLAAIKALPRGDLVDFVGHYKGVEDELKQFQQKLKGCQVIKDLNAVIDHIGELKMKEEAASKRLKDIGQQLDALDIKALKDVLESQLSQLLDKAVTLGD